MRRKFMMLTGRVTMGRIQPWDQQGDATTDRGHRKYEGLV